MSWNPKIFREYDIRGEVSVDFDSDFANKLGVVFARALKRQFPEKQNLKIAVGHDCRLSAKELFSAFVEGVTSQGVSVLSSGMGPTPQLYFSVFNYELDGGVQITASHNPSADNGFKMMIGLETLSGKRIKELESLLTTEDLETKAKNPGSFEQRDVLSDYKKELVKRSIEHVKPAHKIKVVVDAGNGVGGLVGPEVLRELGCEVIEIYTEPDGRFPNHHPDPTVLENIKDLSELVVKHNARLGIAWDGDADRIGVVDEKGQAIYGDMLLVIFGRALLSEVSSPTIIGDVKCSQNMFQSLSMEGAKTVMSKTGHSLIKAKLKELNAELAGEMSGHMFFSHRYFGFDDAIHASCRLIEIVSNTDKPVSELLSDLPKTVSTPEIRVECPEEFKVSIVEKAIKAFPEYEVDTTDGARIVFEKGWGLVRASNTQPVLVMRFEAETDLELNRYENIVKSRIESIKESLGV